MIKKMNLIECTKQTFDATEIVYRALFREQNMRVLYTRVMIKNIAIFDNNLTICLDNICTGRVPYLMVMCFGSDTAFALRYTKHPYNFKNIKIKRINLFHNGMQMPRFSY